MEIMLFQGKISAVIYGQSEDSPDGTHGVLQGHKEIPGQGSFQ